MKSKAPLTLMELMIMVLVFALSAALCLQVFITADRLSRESSARDQAVLTAENAAETVKHYAGDLENAAKSLGGDVSGDCLKVYYDAQWNQVAEDGNVAYDVTVELEVPRQKMLGMANVVVKTTDGTELFRIPVAWHEVSRNE